MYKVVEWKWSEKFWIKYVTCGPPYVFIFGARNFLFGHIRNEKSTPETGTDFWTVSRRFVERRIKEYERLSISRLMRKT